MQELVYRRLDELEDRHWWYVARRRIVLQLLDAALRERSGGERLRLLDIGCGTGGTLRALAPLGDAVGVDTEPGAIEAARRRSGCEVGPGRLPDDMPFADDSFDVITLLDVLEHIEDDAGSLATIARLLRPGGLLLCTVPAFAFLWSGHDDTAEHKRRYTRPGLRARLEGAGLHVRKISYYNTFLFPPILGVHLLLGGRGRGGGTALVEVPAPLNAVLGRIFAAERHWLRFGTFPFGVSVLALARKPGGPT